MNDQVRIAALKIVSNMNRISEIWIAKDYYAKHGAMPDHGNAVRRRISEMSKSELIRFSMNIYPAISKLKAKIKAISKNDPKKVLLIEELQMRQTELEELIKLRDEETV